MTARHARLSFACMAVVMIGFGTWRFSTWFPPARDDDEDVEAVVERLEQELHLHSYATANAANHNRYLTVTPTRREQLIHLARLPEALPRWQGVVMVERVSPKAPVQLRQEWGPAGLRYKNLLFFGDPRLIAHIERNLYKTR
jgi:apolipoprotein N-acyltransferase